MDSGAKVKMRRKVRGLRAIERQVLKERRSPGAPESNAQHEKPNPAGTPRVDPPDAAVAPMAAAPQPCPPSDPDVIRPEHFLEATGVAGAGDVRVGEEAGEVVLGYCAAVRGILNDSQGGPFHPPGLRMSEALQDVRGSLDRSLQGKKGGLPSRC